MRHWRVRRFIIHTLLPVLTTDLPKLQLLAWIINKKKRPRAVKDVRYTMLTTSFLLNNAAQCMEWGIGPDSCISLSPSPFFFFFISLTEVCVQLVGIYICMLLPSSRPAWGSLWFSFVLLQDHYCAGDKSSGINSQQHLNGRMLNGKKKVCAMVSASVCAFCFVLPNTPPHTHAHTKDIQRMHALLNQSHSSSFEMRQNLKLQLHTVAAWHFWLGWCCSWGNSNSFPLFVPHINDRAVL